MSRLIAAAMLYTNCMQNLCRPMQTYADLACTWRAPTWGVPGVYLGCTWGVPGVYQPGVYLVGLHRIRSGGQLSCHIFGDTTKRGLRCNVQLDVQLDQNPVKCAHLARCCSTNRSLACSSLASFTRAPTAITAFCSISIASFEMSREPSAVCPHT